MGNQHSKSESELNEISRDVNSLRQSLRLSRNNLSYDRKQSIVQHLANQSSNVEKLKGKVKQKNADRTLKNISNVMTDILSIDDTTLDSAAIESNSFVHVPINQRQSSGSTTSLASHSNNNMSKNSKKRQSMPRRVVIKSGVPTLREIESKISDLKIQIQTAIANKDTNQLRVLDATIKVMSGDLEMIRVEVDTPLEERKNNLMKKLGILYHKVTKMLNQIKKEELNQNPSISISNKKEHSLNVLSDIEIQLAEYESILDRMLNDKKATNLTTIRSNIAKTGEKLSQIDIIDSEIKEKVVFFSQKIFNMLKNLDNVLQKKEYDSRLNQAIHNYERIINNFKEVNIENTMNSLQNLRQSVQNINDVNDNRKTQKKDLLTRIDQDIRRVNDLFQQQQKDKDIVKEIVEENVILRKKAIKSTDKEYTLLDNFYNYWNNVKNNFKIDEYSDLSLFRLDSVLEEMEKEIHNIRIRIATKCDTNPNRLSRKYSQSVPILDVTDDSAEPVQPVLTQKIVKAKAKIYNLSSPELSKIEEYSDSRILNRFSKLQEIQSQVDYINEKIQDCIDKGIVKSKLERFLKNIKEYTMDENTAVANNACELSNQINELLYKVYGAEFQNSIRYLGIKVQCFNGAKFSAEYNDIKSELIKIRKTLNEFEIPLQYQSFQNEKNQLLQEVNFNLNLLENKVNNIQNKSLENNKNFEKQLQQLNHKVDRFSGSYKGILYNQIERDLHKLLLDVGEHIEDKTSHDEFTRNIEKLLNILEQKATLTQSFKPSTTTTTTDHQLIVNKLDISKIKDSLREIKTQIDKMSENDIEGFTGLQTRLDLINVELNQISTKLNENLEKEKGILINEISTLKIVVDAKVALGMQRRISWPENELSSSSSNRVISPKNDLIKKLKQYEKKFEIIKNNIDTRRSTIEIQRYYQLSEELEILKHELDYLNFIQGSDLYLRKSKLLFEMQYYLDLLEKQTKENAKKLDLVTTDINNHNNKGDDQSLMAKELEMLQNKLEASTIETQTAKDGKLNQLENMELKNLEKQIKSINEIEKKVDVLKSEVNVFIGTESDTNFFELDDTILNLYAKLNKITVKNPEVQEKKIKLLKQLNLIMQNLDERSLETEEIIAIEEKLEKATMEIENFSNTGNNNIRNIKLIMGNINNALENISVNDNLLERKNRCLELYKTLSNKVNILNLQENQPLQNEPSNKQSSTSNYFSVARKTPEGIKIGQNIFTHDDHQQTSSFAEILSTKEENLNRIQIDLTQISDISQLLPLETSLNNHILNLNQLYLKFPDSQHQLQHLTTKINEIKNSIVSFRRNVNKIMESESEIDAINAQISNPCLNTEQLRELDEKLIQLQTSLGNINHNGLKAKRDACMMRIILSFKNIPK